MNRDCKHKEIIDDILLPVTPQEVICKEYMEAKKDIETFKAYVETIDKNKCFDLRLSLPGVGGVIKRPEIIYDFFEDDVKIIRHGRYDIPFKHRHTFFEILYVYQGIAENMVGDHTHILSKNNMMFIPPNVDHTLYTTGVVVNILIKKTFIQNSILTAMPFKNSFTTFLFNSSYTNKQNDYLILDVSDNIKIQDLLFLLIEEDLRTKSDHGNIFKSLLAKSILFLLSRDCGDDVKISKEHNTTNKLVIDIIHYMTDNLSNVTLEEVGKEFNYSLSYLSKIISSTTNMTFKEILYRIRIDKALELLSETEDTIDNVSQRLGYLDVGSFYRAFKNMMGITPNDYRRNCKDTNLLFRQVK